jgi:hypothetical protein
MDLEQAEQVVLARLGRAPQDMLEAAVVLEAWGGVPARRALALGSRLLHGTAGEPAPSIGALPDAPPRKGVVLESLVLLVAILAVACWGAPLTASLGAGTFGRALLIALPLTLALQWALRSRYLNRPDGLAALAARPASTALTALALVALPAATLGQAGMLAGQLALIWVAGVVFAGGWWAAVYASLIGAATGGMLAGAHPELVVAATAAACALAASARLWCGRGPTTGHPGRWGRALGAALIGAGLGFLLLGDPTLGWGANSVVTAMALVPSTVAGLWAGRHLWSFWHALPGSLAGVGIATGRPERVALRILAGAVARLALATAALSAALVLAADQLGLEVASVAVLAAFGAVSLATMLVSLLESIGHTAAGLLAVAGALAGEASVDALGLASVAGGGLLLGASVATFVALAVAALMLSRPASTLATVLWIQ